MRCILLLVAALVASAVASAADDPWAKVVSLRSGGELRIYKKGVREPISATFDQATPERIIYATKTAQSSIAKEDIERIDARPFTKSGTKMTVNSEVKQTDPDQSARPRPGIDVPGTSGSSGVSFGSAPKPDFETVYRRVAAKASAQNPPHPPSPAP